METKADAKKLLEIVKTWHPKDYPVYRSFKCGSCKKFIRKAWHVWLKDGGWKVEVHLCMKCYAKLNKGNKK